MHAPKRRATYADVENAPANVIAEIVDGVLYTQSRPRVRHSQTGALIGHLIGGPFSFDPNGPGGWWILPEVELHLSEDVLVPDLAGWRRERLPKLPRDAVGIDVAPDWICEVLSPSTQAIDRGEKMDVYARAAVAFAWLVDPDAELLEVYRLENDKWLRVATHRGDATVRAEPFDAVAIDLSRLWLR